MAQFNYEVSIPQSVGGYLKRELKRRGTTQEEFSYEFGVDVRTVRRWINGGVHSLDVVVEIAHYFGVSVVDVLSDEEGRPFYIRRKEISLGHFVSFWNLFLNVRIFMLTENLKGVIMMFYEEDFDLREYEREMEDDTGPDDLESTWDYYYGDDECMDDYTPF